MPSEIPGAPAKPNPECACRHSLGAHRDAKACRFCGCQEFHDPSVPPPTAIDTALDLVASAPAFQGVAREHLVDIARYGHQRHFHRDEIILEEGDVSNCVYLVLEGHVKVERTVEPAPPQPIGRLGPGEFVGEMGLIHEALRSATVTAMEDVEALELTLDELKQVLHEDHDLVLAFGRLIQQRQRHAAD